MNKIHKTLWIGLVVNIIAGAVIFIVSAVLNAKDTDLGYDLRSISHQLNDVKYFIIAIILVQFLNIFAILKMGRFSLFTSILSVILFLPAGIIYYVGCMFSIKNVELSAFERWNGVPDQDAVSAKFNHKKHSNELLIFFALSVVSFFLSSALFFVVLLRMVLSGIAFARAERHLFISATNEGYAIMPDLFGYPVLIRSSDIKNIVKTDKGAILETSRGNITLKASLAEKGEFDRVFAQVALSVMYEQQEASFVEPAN